MPPISLATMGTPMAIASRTTVGQGSGQMDGTTTREAWRYAVTIWSRFSLTWVTWVGSARSNGRKVASTRGRGAPEAQPSSRTSIPLGGMRRRQKEHNPRPGSPATGEPSSGGGDLPGMKLGITIGALRAKGPIAPATA